MYALVINVSKLCCLWIFYKPTFSFVNRCVGKCKDEGSSGGGDDAAELGIGTAILHTGIFISLNTTFFSANVGGVFLVLGFGCLFALIVAIIEFLWNVKKIAVEEKV